MYVYACPMGDAIAMRRLLLLLLTVGLCTRLHAADIPSSSEIVGLWEGRPGYSEGLTLVDWSDQRRDGTLSNMGYNATSGWSGTDLPGAYAQLNFDGVDDYVTIGGTPEFDYLNTNFSVSLWVRAAGAQPGGVGYPIAHRVGNVGGSGGWFLRFEADGTLAARVVGNANGSAAQLNTTDTTLLDGRWRFVTVNYTTDTTTSANNDVHIFINGRQDEGTRNSGGEVAFTCVPD